MRFINQKIQEDLFPNRSVESIKGKRRGKDYKDLLAGLVTPPAASPIEPCAPLVDVSVSKAETPLAEPVLTSEGGRRSKRIQNVKTSIMLPTPLQPKPPLTTSSQATPMPHLVSAMESASGLPWTTDTTSPVRPPDPIDSPVAQAAAGSMGNLAAALDEMTTALQAPYSVPPDGLPGPPDSPAPSEGGTAESDGSLAARLDEMKAALFAACSLRPPRTSCPILPRRQTPISATVRKRRCYAVTQRRWRKDRGSIVRDILGNKDLTEPVTPDGTQAFWARLFGRASPDPPPHIPVNVPLAGRVCIMELTMTYLGSSLVWVRSPRLVGTESRHAI